jgi:hypothetical protein
VAQVSIQCCMRHALMHRPAALRTEEGSPVRNMLACGRRQSNGTMEEAREALADPQAEVHLQVGAAQGSCCPLLLAVNRMA